METVIATSKFDCRDRNGDYFVAVLKIGDPEDITLPTGPEGKFNVSLEPLFDERPCRGADSFQALCLSIDLVRKAFRAFVAHGGMVYYHRSRSPINIDDASFVPIAQPIAKRFLLEYDDDDST